VIVLPSLMGLQPHMTGSNGDSVKCYLKDSIGARPALSQGVTTTLSRWLLLLLRILILSDAALTYSVAASEFQPLFTSAPDVSQSYSQEGSSGDVLAPGLLQHIARGHHGAIYTLAFAPDDLLASGAKDHSIAIWNLTGSFHNHKTPSSHRLEGHFAGVTALAFAPRAGYMVGASTSEVLISGGADRAARIWDVRSARLLKTVPHPKTVFGIAVRPEAISEEGPGGQFATACWDGIVRIFDWPLGVQKAELSGHLGGLYAVAYSPLDGSLLASASADRTIRVWDLRTMEMLWTLRGHKDHVTTVDWSPNQLFALASGGWDRRFHFWELGNVEAESCRSALGKENCSRALAPPRFSNRHPQLLWRVAFAPGGELVAACHGAIGQSPTVVVYRVSTGRIFRRLGRHSDTPLALAWSGDGSMLASAGMDRHVLVYDGDSELSDLPQGDPDDAEEQDKWRNELDEFRTGQSPPGTEHNHTENTSERMDDRAQWLAHPLSGRGAFL